MVKPVGPQSGSLTKMIGWSWFIQNVEQLPECSLYKEPDTLKKEHIVQHTLETILVDTKSVYGRVRQLSNTEITCAIENNLDSDVLAELKQMGRGYKLKINEIRWDYLKAQKQHAA